MICIIAFVVFGVMAVFSASYRPLAAEAFDCVFRRLTFRKCRTSLDEKIKSQVTGRIMRHSQRSASLVFRHFELLSWIFVIITVVSLAYSGYSTYNYIQYGNCYGPEVTGGFCIYNALEREKFTELQREIEGEIVLPDADDDPAIGLESARVTMIEFGCYSCPHTREAQQIVSQVVDQYKNKIRYVFRDFPIEQAHGDAFVHSEAANCALEQGRFWEMHDLIFTEQEVCGTEETDPGDHIDDAAERIGLNMKEFNRCMDEHRYREEIEKDFDDGLKAGVSGTPTFFINGRRIIGPKPVKAFQKIIDEELEKAEDGIQT